MYEHICVYADIHIFYSNAQESFYFLSIMFTYIHILPSGYSFGSGTTEPLDV